MWFKNSKSSESNNMNNFKIQLRQYEAIFNTTEDAIFLIQVIEERDFKFIQTNKSHQIKTGITPEMINDKTPKELLGNEIGDLIENNYRKCVQAKKRIEYVESLSLPAGLRTWKTTLTPVFDDNDKIVFIVGIAYDITEQENFIKELKKANEKLNAILETSPDGICIIDLLGNFKFASEKILEMLGIKRDRMDLVIGKNIKEFISQNTYEQLKSNISVLINKGSFHKPNIYEFADKNGGIRYAEVQSKVLKGYEGQADSILIIARDITERRLTEIEKEKSRRIYQILFETSPSGILLLSEEGIIIDANSAFLKISGYKKEELINKHCSILSKENDENPISDNIKRIINGEHLIHEVTNIRRDGSIVHLLLNESLIELVDGQKAILSISNDITEFKKKDLMLKESELLFRTIADYSFDWTYLIDDTPSIKYMSPSVERITGFRQKEFENDLMLFLNIIHPDDRELYISKHKIENNSYDFPSDPETLEYRIITKDGKTKYISHSCAPIYDSEGKFFGRRVTNRDITPLIQKNLEIEFDKKRLENIIDGTQVGTWEWNIQTDELHINSYWASILGYTLEELEPITIETFNNLVHPTDKEMVYELIEQHLKGEIDLLEVEIRMKHKNGKWVWIWDKGKLITKDSEGNPEWMIGLNIDITKQKEFEDELRDTLFDLQETRRILEDSLFERNELIEELSVTKEKLEKINYEKDKFFSIIAHDLRSPLSSFAGLTKLIVEDYDTFSDEELREMIVEMRNSSSNVYKLLENLLEWSRLQRGVMKFEPEPLDLTYLIDQNIALQKETANLKNIKLINLVDKECYIEADVTMLNTIFRNLLSNAIKFTPRNGEIKIGTLANTEGHQTVIYVQDSGIGIAKEDIEKIFHIEHKVNRLGTEGEPSSGLGLLLCKEFIEKHDGKIWIESELNKGSTFYFTMKKVNRN